MGLINLDILVVDNYADLGNTLVNLLTSSGHRAKCVRDSKEALVELEQWRNYNVLVSDIDLGVEMSGIKLAEEVRQRFPEIFIILISGREENIRKAEEKGFKALLKPFRLPELQKVLAEKFPNLGSKMLSGG